MPITNNWVNTLVADNQSDYDCFSSTIAVWLQSHPEVTITWEPENLKIVLTYAPTTQSCSQ